MVDACAEDPCPVWSGWSEWSECSSSCGAGSRRRARRCTDPITNDESEGCEGDEEETETCNEEKACPSWSPWSEWTTCTVSCGPGGRRSRGRQCRLEDDQVDGCEGETVESLECNADRACPDWGPWTEWGACSASCGGGTSKRIRDCLLPRPQLERDCSKCNGTNFHGCAGESLEVRSCNTK